MTSMAVSEQQILEALRRVPLQRWPQVLQILDSMNSNHVAPTGELLPIHTGGRLEGFGADWHLG
jgi:hypothetical protein